MVDQLTGEVRPAQIFVAVMDASNFTYAEASWTATSGARSRAMRRSRNALPSRWRSPIGCAFRITGSAVPRSMPACARGRVHRQGKGQSAVRVRLQEPAPAKAGVSVVAPATKPKGGQFVLLHAEALHGNPFDGLTLAPVIVELEALTGVETRRIHVDKSLPLRRQGAIAVTTTPRSSASGSVARYAASPPRSAGRCVAALRRAGHRAHQGRAPDGSQLPQIKGCDGDLTNAVLAAAGYNFSLLLRWLERLLRALIRMLLVTPAPPQNA